MTLIGASISSILAYEYVKCFGFGGEPLSSLADLEMVLESKLDCMTV